MRGVMRYVIARSGMSLEAAKIIGGAENRRGKVSGEKLAIRRA
jgi:hypothetical protein